MENNKDIELIFKWLKSENASSNETKRLANKTRKYLNMTHREYRKLLSYGRKKTKVLERLMSANQWDKIDFSKIPSKAGLIYRNAFARRDIIAKKYEAFAKDENTKVNAETLYPYDVVAKAAKGCSGWGYRFDRIDETERAMIEKYWQNLPNYLNGKPCKMMCVIDTSGSMCGTQASSPINIAIGLGMYCAERIGGPFKNHYISFSSRPQLISIEGVDFVDKVQRIYRTNLCENTDLVKTFDMLLKASLNAKPEDRLDTVVVISDMEIDCGTRFHGRDNMMTEMESMRVKWEAAGLQMPRLVYWEVDARNNNFLDLGPNISYVSGASPTIFKQIITGVSGYDLMIQTLDSERYKAVV